MPKTKFSPPWPSGLRLLVITVHASRNMTHKKGYKRCHENWWCQIECEENVILLDEYLFIVYGRLNPGPEGNEFK